jgi:hypothetical protein
MDCKKHAFGRPIHDVVDKEKIKRRKKKKREIGRTFSSSSETKKKIRSILNYSSQRQRQSEIERFSRSC